MTRYDEWVKAHIGSAPMPTTKLMPCRDCGQMQVVSIFRSKPIKCADCNYDVMIDAIRQLANKSGPVYDKCVAATRDGISRRGRGRAPDRTPIDTALRRLPMALLPATITGAGVVSPVARVHRAARAGVTGLTLFYLVR